MEDAYTANTAISSAAIANRDGNYVTPTPATITADAAAKPAITVQDFSIVDNQPGPTPTRSSPTAGLLVSASQSSQATGKALVGFLRLAHRPWPARRRRPLLRMSPCRPLSSSLAPPHSPK